MNPPTDCGKRQLSSNIRSRFTEFFVYETTEPDQLAVIIKSYLPTISAQRLNSLVNFYTDVRALMPRKYRQFFYLLYVFLILVCEICAVHYYLRMTTHMQTSCDHCTKGLL